MDFLKYPAPFGTGLRLMGLWGSLVGSGFGLTRAWQPVLFEVLPRRYADHDSWPNDPTTSASAEREAGAMWTHVVRDALDTACVVRGAIFEERAAPMDQNERLFRHDRWMTNLMFDAAANLSDAALDQEFEIGHRTVRATLDHITVGIELWTALMHGEPGLWEPRRGDVETMRARQSDAYDQFEAAARKVIADGRLDETFIDAWDYQQSLDGWQVRCPIRR